MSAKEEYKGFAIISNPKFSPDHNCYFLNGHVHPKIDSFKFNNETKYENENVADISFINISKNIIDGLPYPKIKVEENRDICSMCIVLCLLPFLMALSTSCLALAIQILKFIKTGIWVFTLRDLLTIMPTQKSALRFYFDYPDYRGIEQILNWLFGLNATISLLLISFVSLIIGILLIKFVVSVCPVNNKSDPEDTNV